MPSDRSSDQASQPQLSPASRARTSAKCNHTCCDLCIFDLPVPCQCLASALPVPCQCLASALPVPCHCLSSALLVRFYCGVISFLIPYKCTYALVLLLVFFNPCQFVSSCIVDAVLVV